MSEKSEKEIRKMLTKDYEEIKKSIETVLNVIGFEVVYVSCNIAAREGHNIFLTIKRRELNG